MSFKRILSLLVALALASSFLFLLPVSAENGGEITVLFTHDLHSHLLPSANESGEGEYGGYARLMTKIKERFFNRPF